MASRAPGTTTRRAPPASVFQGYAPLPRTFDECFDDAGTMRSSVQNVLARIDDLGPSELRARAGIAEAAFLRHGVTFSVYSDDKQGVERIFPFDLIPRIVTPREWDAVRRGLEQRIAALDAFLADLYGKARILAEKPLLRGIVEASKGYLPVLRGIRPPGGVHAHVAGIDLIRDAAGTFTVLEDNLRVPSGVSYVLENRAVMKRTYPLIFPEARVRTVEEYPLELKRGLASVAPDGRDAPRIVILTPGPLNSAYFEHAFLARRAGCELVQGSDLFVHDRRVYLKSTRGPEPVDVIYRRIDDLFLDPEVFRPDSTLGVPGLLSAYAAGNVTLANAPGNGVADDKAVYPFIPEVIRFYLDEEPLLPQVETHVCARAGDMEYVLANLSSLVVKAVDEAGGYGMLMGPEASKRELADFRDRVRAHPRGYIAQPRIELSTCPTLVGSGVEPRRVDLRPYIIRGERTWVLPGGLTRVALRKGSYVVNSSQGGGSKDTWVLES